MSKFSNVSALKVEATETINFPLSFLAETMPDAELTVRPATVVNKAYHAPFTKQMARVFRGSRGQVTPQTLTRTYQIARPLFAQHVITGWRGIVDDSGADASFNQEDCLAFLTALPDSLFAEVYNFCIDEGNFRDARVLDDLNDEEVAKN